MPKPIVLAAATAAAGLLIAQTAPAPPQRPAPVEPSPQANPSADMARPRPVEPSPQATRPAPVEPSPQAPRPAPTEPVPQ